MKGLLLLSGFLALVCAASGQGKTTWKIVEQKNKKQIDISIGGKLMTSYCYYDSVRKPILFPVNTLSGVTVTRGYPIKPLPGERVDHPHHTGLWLNYEFVSGLDFWNNSTAIAPNERFRYGTILHTGVLSSLADKDHAELTVGGDWVAIAGTVLLKEKTQFVFRDLNGAFVIDRITVLTAGANDVFFKDIKDGMLAIRVASELEMPSKETLELVDIHGNKTKVEGGSKTANGMYISSEGITGDAVWSSRGRWCVLAGKKDGEDVSIGIVDHPKNVGYPTYWHARGYGLFAANPLGQEIFSLGKNKLNFNLAAGKSVTFRYRIVIASGMKLSGDRINLLADKFASEYND